MTAALVSAGTRGTATTGTTITPALPASCITGDLMIAVVSIKSNATISTPAGWTKLQQTNSGASFTTAVYWRLWQPTDVAVVYSWSGSVNNEGQVLRVSGADQTAPIATAGAVGTGTTSPHVSTGFNTAKTNSLIVLIDAGAAATALTNPAGWTALAGGASNVAEFTFAWKVTGLAGSATGSTSSAGAAAAYTQQQIEIFSNKAPFLDGVASNIFTAATSGTVTLTTTRAGDIICVAAAGEIEPTTSPPTITSVTASGLTFVNRMTLAGTAVGLWLGNNTGYGSFLTLYWAYASAALTGTVITITIGQTVDDAAIIAFGVANANITTPFDVNVSLPATTTSATHADAATTATGISTSNPNAMLIGVLSYFNNSNAQPWPQVAGAGFTAIASPLNTGGALQAGVEVEIQVVSAQQVAATLGYTGTQQDFYMIMDAIQAAAPSPPVHRSLRQYLRR